MIYPYALMLNAIHIRPNIASTAPSSRLFFCRNSTWLRISFMKGEFVTRTTPTRVIKTPMGKRI